MGTANGMGRERPKMRMQINKGRDSIRTSLAAKVPEMMRLELKSLRHRCRNPGKRLHNSESYLKKKQPQEEEEKVKEEKKGKDKDMTNQRKEEREKSPTQRKDVRKPEMP